MRSVIKLADLPAVASSTVLVDDPELQVAIAANQKLIFAAKLYFANSVAGSAKFTVVGPGGAAGTISYEIEGLAGASGYFALGTALAFSLSTTTEVVNLTATVRNGATPGFVKVQLAQNTGDSTATQILHDSFVLSVP